MLIQNHADVNVKDKDQWTPLLYASWKGYDKIAEMLIQNGADLNAKDKKGWTPTHLAARNGIIYLIIAIAKIAKTFTIQHTNIISTNYYQWQKNLLCDWELVNFSFSGHEKIIRMLIQNHADVNTKLNELVHIENLSFLDPYINNNGNIFLSST